jgi:hypothetical protein
MTKGRAAEIVVSGTIFLPPFCSRPSEACGKMLKMNELSSDLELGGAQPGDSASKRANFYPIQLLFNDGGSKCKSALTDRKYEVNRNRLFGAGL